MRKPCLSESHRSYRIKRSRRLWPLLSTMLLAMLLGMGLAACQPVNSAARQAASYVSDEADGEEEVELANLMAAMQRHSAKLGYAVEGRNQPLAQFYLEELEEVLEKVGEVDEYEGMPIAHTSQVILHPLLITFEEQLARQEWEKTWTAYENLIQGCNRCHMATEHGFVQIVPAHGEPPFNQIFTAP